MFAFLFKKAPIKEEVDVKISKHILGFLGSEDIACVLPRVHPTLKTELETTFSELRAVACERVLIYKQTLKPCSIFENPDSFAYIKLSGGYSNSTYKLSKSGSRAYISRIPGMGTDLFIDRTAEWHNASIAAELELNPTIVYNDKRGSQLSHCLSSPQPLTPELLHEHPEYIEEIALQLRKLHQSPKKFHNNVSIFKRNAEFYTLIQDSELALPEEYEPIRARTAQLERLFEKLDIPSAPCHNDTYYNNFILSEGKLWLIDWEFSGNHDPIWDLAYFSNLAKLTEEQNKHLLISYFNCADFKSEYSLEYLRFIAYSLVVKDFLILWTFVQLANKNMTVSEPELLKWAEGALTESAQIMSNDKFNNTVELLEKASEVHKELSM